METKTENDRRLAFGVALGLGLLVALFSLSHIVNDDQWWHILTGRWILDTGSIPLSDPFSFTHHGHSWVQWEWLSGLLAALAWDGGGAWGLSILRGLVLAAFLFLLARQILTQTKPSAPGARVALAFLLAAVMMVVLGRLGDRPHFYMLPLFAGLALLTDRMRKGIGPRELAFLVLLFALWTSVHPSWIMGLGMLGAAGIDRLFERERPLGRSEFLRWLIAGVLAACVVALALSWVNPAHFGEALKEIFAKKVSAEWDALSKHIGPQIAPTNAFLLLALFWLVSLPLWFRRRAFGSLSLSAACVVMAVLHVRFTVEASILLAPMIAAWLLPLGERLLPSERNRWLVLSGVVLIAAVLTLGFLRQQNRSLGVGVDERSNPVSQADFLERAGFSGRAFATTKEAHGYLAFRLWPAVHIFIDGRVPQVFPQSFLDLYDTSNDAESLLKTLADWRADLVVLANGLFTPTSEGVGQTLLAEGSFALVYFDENGAVFCKRGPACRGQRPFAAINPWTIDNDWPRSALAQHDRKSLADELERLKRLAPEHTLTKALEKAMAVNR